MIFYGRQSIDKFDEKAVISALNFANDSLNHKDITNTLNFSIKERILKLHQKIDVVLEN